MENDDLEEEVVSFIFENIESVPHLEALLLIWQSGASPWTPEQLASRLYINEHRGKSILDDLRRRGYLMQEPAESGPYTFATDSELHRRLMPRIDQAYRKHLVRITRLIHSKGSASVREFARAFQIKKDQ